MKYIFLFIFIFTLLSVAFTGLSAPAQNLCKSGAGGYCVNLAAVTVPGLEFLEGTPGDAGGLIARLFVFGLSLVGISALIMFVFAGVVYMTAGDSQSRVNQARSMMGNAVFGLVLALISYLILYTINPDIVTRGFPNPAKIKAGPPITLPIGGLRELPRGGLGEPGAVPPVPAQPTPENTCSQYYKLINGKCYGFVTQSPCSPPELYNLEPLSNTCHLKR